MTRGSVAAVLVPGRPDSAGAQFFIVLADQPALDGQYTVFGQVSDGMEVLQKISETPVDAGGLATERVEIRRVTIRDTPAGAVRHRDAAGAGRLPRGARHQRRADHDRVLPRQGARTRPPVHAAGGTPASTTAWRSTASRRASSSRPARSTAAPAPLTEKQQKLVRNLQPEFNDTKHVKGIVSMARGDDPASATTSFFICTGAVDGARRRLHGVRPGGRRDGGRRGDRDSAANRRDAERRASS